jgi:hypothetical protein
LAGFLTVAVHAHALDVLSSELGATFRHERLELAVVLAAEIHTGVGAELPTNSTSVRVIVDEHIDDEGKAIPVEDPPVHLGVAHIPELLLVHHDLRLSARALAPSFANFR